MACGRLVLVFAFMLSVAESVRKRSQVASSAGAEYAVGKGGKRSSKGGKKLIYVGLTKTYKCDYNIGIMINYEVSFEDLRQYVPEPLTPLKLSLVESDPEPKYYVSLYLAKIFLNDITISENSRADVFTYVTDAEGRKMLLFLSVLIEVPNGAREGWFTWFMERFMINSETGKSDIPHMVLDSISLSADAVDLKMQQTTFQAALVSESTTRFSLDFMLVNSGIYHSPQDYTMNFFNYQFMDAVVHNVNPAAVNSKEVERFHPLCKADKLASVQRYGGEGEPIVWYFQPDRKSEVTPAQSPPEAKCPLACDWWKCINPKCSPCDFCNKEEEEEEESGGKKSKGGKRSAPQRR